MSNLGRLGGLLVTLGAVAACSTPPSSSAGGAAPAAVSTSTPSSPFAAIARNVLPIAKAEFDIGRRDPALPAAGSLYFQPSAEQIAARESLVAAVQDPASPMFHKWITPEEFAARFGAKPADIARVTAWLAGQGFTIDPPSPLGTRVGFRGTSGQVEAAFRTEFHNYKVGRVTHYAMATPPQVPSELAPVVMGLHGFHDFHPRAVSRPMRHPGPEYKDANQGLTLAPGDFQVLYNTKPLLAAGTDGTGVNIAIIGQTYIVPADVAAFRKKFGITSHEHDIVVPGTGDANTVTGDVGEAELDLEWSSAVAPGANLLYVYAGADQPPFSVDDSVVYVVEQGTKLAPGVGNGGAQIISESYGSCDLYESSVNGDVDSEIAAAANLEGITYIAASGDHGSQNCYDPAQGGVPGLYTGPPADLPGVTAVGGTEFCGGSKSYGCIYGGTAAPPDSQVSPYFNLTTDVALEYPEPAGEATLEAVWNDTQADPTYGDYWSAGGGAPSIIFPKPFYQDTRTFNDGVRDVPDVSLTASPNEVAYEIYEQGDLEDGGTSFATIGGTSAATPSFAGIMALVNQSVHAHGGALGLGNINPLLYAFQASSSGASVFHDIVTGNNDMACLNTVSAAGLDAGVTPDTDCPASGTYGGFSAGVGYDLASGLGTINAQELVNAWLALSPTTTTVTAPATATVGTPVTLTADVTSAATSNPIGGTVSFTFQTSTGSLGPVYGGDAGVPDESWLLGTVNIAASAGTPEKGTATLTAAIPPGLSGKAYVVALYNGDTHYLASHSAQSAVTVSGSTLKIDPATITLPPFGHTTLQTTGGTPPVTWNQIGSDTTCDAHYNCSYIESESPTEAYVQAGATVGGTITFVAIDVNGEEATAKITIAGAAVDAGTYPTFDAGAPGGPLNPPVPDASVTVVVDSGSPDAGPVDAGPGVDSGLDATTPIADSGVDSSIPPQSDAGVDSSAPSEDSGPVVGEDSGPVVSEDSGPVVDEDSGPINFNEDSGPITTEDSGPVTSEDSGTGTGGGSSSGCSCTTAGSDETSKTSPAGLMGGLVFGAGILARRRRRARR